MECYTRTDPFAMGMYEVCRYSMYIRNAKE